MDDMYNGRQLELAGLIASATGYRIADSGEENSAAAGGNTVHFASEYYNIPAITVETIMDEAMFPLDAKYYDMVYKRIKEVPYTIARWLTV